jgi:hypothetical protein
MMYLSPLVPAAAASKSSSKCPQVEIVTVPMFLLEGEQTWVHARLYARRASGQPDFDRLLDENYFYVQAPSLDREESSRTLAIGLMESSCVTALGMKILAYQVTLNVARTSNLFLPNLGDADFTIFTTVENTKLMPRLQLWSAAGLHEERQILPYSGDRFESSLSKTFAGTGEEFWSHSNFWIQIIHPVESPIFGMVCNKSGECSKAVEPTTECDLPVPTLITNITQEVLGIDLVNDRVTRITLSPGESQRLESAASTIRSPRAILVSPIRTLDDGSKPLPRAFPSRVR